MEGWAESQDILQEADNLRASGSPDPQVGSVALFTLNFTIRELSFFFLERFIAVLGNCGSIGYTGYPVTEGLVVLNPAPS